MGSSIKESSFTQDIALSSFAVMVSQEIERVVEVRTKIYTDAMRDAEAKILHYSNIIEELYGLEAQKEYDKFFEITRVRSGRVEKTTKKKK